MSLGPIFDLFPVWNSRRRRRVVKSKSTKRALRWRRMSDWDILIVYLKIVKNQTRKLCVVFFFVEALKCQFEGESELRDKRSTFPWFTFKYLLFIARQWSIRFFYKICFFIQSDCDDGDFYANASLLLFDCGESLWIPLDFWAHFSVHCKAGHLKNKA